MGDGQGGAISTIKAYSSSFEEEKRRVLLKPVITRELAWINATLGRPYDKFSHLINVRRGMVGCLGGIYGIGIRDRFRRTAPRSNA